MSISTDKRPENAPAATRRRRWSPLGGLLGLMGYVGFIAGMFIPIAVGKALIGDTPWLWLPAILCAFLLSYLARKLVLTITVRR